MPTDGPLRSFSQQELDAAAARVGERWESTRRARILLTGGTGFVGRWLVGTLAAARRARQLECSLILVTRHEAGTHARWPWLAQQSWISLVESDVRRLHRLDGPIDVILHGASDTSLQGRESDMVDVCEQGTHRLTELAELRRTRRFHLLGSGAVYGPRAPGGADPHEQEMLDPSVPGPYGAYSQGKRIAEALVRQMPVPQDGAVTVSRIFGLIGPGLPLDGRFAVGNFVRDALRGGPIRVRGDGRSVRSYLHGADMAEWIWTITLGAPHGSILNVGSGEGITMWDLACRVRALLRPEAGVVVEADPAASSTRYVPDVGAALKLLGLRPTISLDEAVVGMGRHYHPTPDRP